MKRYIKLAVMILGGFMTASACTSMVVSARASKSGRPMLWKHRDTSCAENFVERSESTASTFAYVALYNAGDSILNEAWAGMNSQGFAIMNTASYNLEPDTAQYKDREGEVMTAALKRCRTVDDFGHMLENMRQPRGVQANFGVIDAFGGAAYFEVSDNTIVRFNADDTEYGCMIRTNYSTSGEPDKGYGYIRYENAAHILAEAIETHSLTPQDFTERASRSFYHAVFDKDMATEPERWAIDQDFIPRYTSTASIVIEGVNDIMESDKAVMWTAIGYPPCAVVRYVTVKYVPDCLRPLLHGYRCADCEDAGRLKEKAFPITRGNGKHYIDLDFVRSCSARCHAESMKNYNSIREH